MATEKPKPPADPPPFLCELCAELAVMCFTDRDLGDGQPILRHFCKKHGQEYAAGNPRLLKPEQRRTYQVWRRSSAVCAEVQAGWSDDERERRCGRARTARPQLSSKMTISRVLALMTMAAFGCADNTKSTPSSARPINGIPVSNSESSVRKDDLSSQAMLPNEILFPTLKAGFYSGRDSTLDQIEHDLEKSDFTIWLSWHNGISFRNGEWRNKLTLNDVRKIASERDEKTLALILLEKNYNESGPDATHQKILSILRNLDYKVIVVQTGHSSGVWINEVRRAPFDNESIQSVE